MQRVIMIDWVELETKFFDIEEQVAPGVYKLKGYPTLVYLFREDENEAFQRGELVDIQPGEVSMQKV